jgi:hypothetical protein
MTLGRRRPWNAPQNVNNRLSLHIVSIAYAWTSTYLQEWQSRDLVSQTSVSADPTGCCTSFRATESVFSSCLDTCGRCGEVALTRLLCIPRGMVRCCTAARTEQGQSNGFRAARRLYCGLVPVGQGRVNSTKVRYSLFLRLIQCWT